ncbi:MAG TPA: formylmethanofuran dehydrogenase subunit C [Methanoregulaceae archaeon]|nr:formylmethanofuran dehydrogenase subunit C [Methanoregulaceae archaeon]
MAMVKLTPIAQSELCLDCYAISPDAMVGLGEAEIADLAVWEGKVMGRLGDYFAVSGSAGRTPDETEIVVDGDASRMKYIGYKMTGGQVTVKGNADMYVGGWMKGGTIHIKGNVDSFCGIQMEGGEILVDGRAQNHVGCSYRGDWRGMRGGTLRIHGDAGNDIGTFINGGTIIIEGNAFIHVSTHGEGGTVIVKGDVQGRVGGQMVKGDIYVLGAIEHMLPGFKKIETVDMEVDGAKYRLDHYVGDLGERHPTRRGEPVLGNLYVRAAA